MFISSHTFKTQKRFVFSTDLCVHLLWLRPIFHRCMRKTSYKHWIQLRSDLIIFFFMHSLQSTFTVQYLWPREEIADNFYHFSVYTAVSKVNFSTVPKMFAVFVRKKSYGNMSTGVSNCHNTPTALWCIAWPLVM